MQRYSQKRQAIYDCLCATRSHPSAEWVYHQLKGAYPDLSLGTVYRNLNQLEEAGQITSVGTIRGHKRYDADLTPHSHIICRGCGAIIDLPTPKLPDTVLQNAQTTTHCRLTGITLQFSGYCPDCSKLS